MSDPGRLPPVTTAQQHPLVRIAQDVYYGAVYGDFSPPGRGMATVATRIAMGYFPGVGQICAVRDYIANRRRGDHIGAILCLLSFLPILGGFPKTAEVLRSVRFFRFSMRLQRRLDQTTGQQASPAVGTHPAVKHTVKHNVIGYVSALLAILAPALILVLWAMITNLATPAFAHDKGSSLLLLFGISLLVSLIEIVISRIGMRRARRHARRRGFGSSLFGFVVGWAYLGLVLITGGCVALLLRVGLIR